MDLGNTQAKIMTKLSVIVECIKAFLYNLLWGPCKDNALSKVPGPTALPVFGSLWSSKRWLGGPYAGKEYHVVNRMRLAEYGPVVRENIFQNYPLIHLYGGEDIKRVLSDGDVEFPLRPPNLADVWYRNVKGKAQYDNIGFVNMNGEEWHRLRSKFGPPLGNRGIIRNCVSSMNQVRV